jgi:hypothetical protein
VSTLNTDITPIKKRSLGVVKKPRRTERNDAVNANNAPATMQVDETPIPGPSSEIHSEAPGSQQEQRRDADELAELRELLKPPPISGVIDWGIPSATEEQCDEELEVCMCMRYILYFDHSYAGL